MTTDILQSPLAEFIKERSFFEAVFVNSPVGIALTDSTGRFLDVNEAFANILGCARTELVERSFQEFTYQLDVLPSMKMFNALLRGGVNSYEMEERFVRKDGSLVWVRIKVNAVRPNAETTHAVKHIIRIEPQALPSKAIMSDVMRDPLIRRYVHLVIGLLVWSVAASIVNILHLLGAIPALGN